MLLYYWYYHCHVFLQYQEYIPSTINYLIVSPLRLNKITNRRLILASLRRITSSKNTATLIHCKKGVKILKVWRLRITKCIKIIFDFEKWKVFIKSLKNHFRSNEYVDMFLNFFRLILDWIFSSLSRWALTFNNQVVSNSTYLILHQKMPIRLKSFLQCSCSNKSRHLPFNSSIPFFHSFSTSSDGFSKHNLFYVDKPSESNSNDLHISRNSIWKKVLNISESLKQVFV